MTIPGFCTSFWTASPEALAKCSEEAMVAHYGAAQITLHVRKSNRAAISLYRDTLGFEVHAMEKGYCGSL